MKVIPAEVGAPRPTLRGVWFCALGTLKIHNTNPAAADRPGEAPAPGVAYHARREGNVIIALTCSDPGGTWLCFRWLRYRTKSFDLMLTELIDQAGHRLLVQPGSQPGEKDP